MSEEMKESKDIIKQIVDSAAKKGSISYKEIIDYLEKYQLEANQIEKIYHLGLIDYEEKEFKKELVEEVNKMLNS